MLKVIIFAITMASALAQYRKPIGSPAYYGSYAPVPRPAYAAPRPIYAAYAAPAAAYVDAPSYDKPSPYSFGYNVDDGYGNTNFRNEEGDDYGAKRGSYGYTDAYGIYRKVEYVADKDGFRATVSTNEPGTANADPADVKIHSKESPAVVVPAPAYHAASYAPRPYASYPVPAYRPYGARARAARA
jgi:hypothetical protein